MPVDAVSYTDVADIKTLALFMPQTFVHYSQKLDHAGQGFPVITTVQHLANVSNLLMVDVRATKTDLQLLLSVLAIVLAIVSSYLFIVILLANLCTNSET